MNLEQTNVVHAFNAAAIVSGLDDLGSGITGEAGEPWEDGHKVYNFEVAGTHTYIADGVRVHNKSVLSFLSNEQLRNLDSVDDTNNDGQLDYATVVGRSSDGSVYGQTTYKLATVDGEQVAEGFWTGVFDGELVQIQLFLGEGGAHLSKPIVRPLTGAQAGEDLGAALTPFLTTAILGDNANAFEKYASDTILGTFLENILEFSGGHIHDQILSAGKQDAGVPAIVDYTFNDFGFDLASNAIDNGQSLLNQWIKAEIFGGAFGNDVSGSVANALATHGINYVTDAALYDVASTMVPDPATLQKLGITNPSAVDSFSIDSLVGLVGKAVIDDLLPDVETLEGQVAQASATAILPNLIAVSGAVPPAIVFAIVGNLIGKVFDRLFADHPEAFAEVAFNPTTGLFELTGNYPNKEGGDVAAAKEMSTVYVETMNNYINYFESSIHNYDEIGNWAFGHVESTISNRGWGGAQFKTFEEAFIDALVQDLGNVRLADGAMPVVRAIEALNIAERHDTYEALGRNTGIIEDARNISISNSSPEFGVELALIVKLHVEAAVLALESQYRKYDQQEDHGPDYPRVLSELKKIFPSTLVSWKSMPTRWNSEDRYDEPIGYVDWFYNRVDVQTGSSDDSTVSYLVFDADSVFSVNQIQDYEGLLSAYSINDDDIYSDRDLYGLILDRMLIASDYAHYLENSDAIDTLIAADPQSNFAAGWAATFLAASDMGLMEAFNVAGDAGDNLFKTSTADDSVAGGDGDDNIFAFAGADTIDGGNGHDSIEGGRGADLILGGMGNDTINGGAGDDSIDGGGWSDVIIGGLGGDTLTGRGGRDKFEFDRSSGDDTITDFSLVYDTVRLIDAGQPSKAYVHDLNGEANIWLGSDASVTMLGVTANELDTSHFELGDNWTLVFGLPPTGSSQGGDTSGGSSGGSTGSGGSTSGSGGSTSGSSPLPQPSDYSAVLDYGSGEQGTSASEWITGTAGNDNIKGNGGDDYIIAGGGNDTWVTGGSGDDIFEFGLGDGKVVIGDFLKGADKVLLTDGLTLSDFTRSPDTTSTGTEYVSYHLPTGEELLIRGSNVDMSTDLADHLWAGDTSGGSSGGSTGSGGSTSGSGGSTSGSSPLPQPSDYSAVLDYGSGEQGTSASEWITGTAGNDNIKGNGGDDYIIAGGGNDTWVTGGSGDDIFEFGLGDGKVVIGDFLKGADKVLLTDGLTLSDFTRSPDTTSTGTEYVSYHLPTGEELLIRGSNVDMSTDLADHLWAGDTSGGSSGGSTGSGGSTSGSGGSTSGSSPLPQPSDYSAVLDYGSGEQGTSASEWITGTAGNDNIKGNGGDDYIIAGGGNDTWVTGGSGDDIFEFGLGDGKVVIGDFLKGADKVLLTDGLTLSDFTRSPDTTSTGTEYVSYHLPTGEELLIRGSNVDMSTDLADHLFV